VVMLITVAPTGAIAIGTTTIGKHDKARNSFPGFFYSACSNQRAVGF